MKRRPALILALLALALVPVFAYCLAIENYTAAAIVSIASLSLGFVMACVVPLPEPGAALRAVRALFAVVARRRARRHGELVEESPGHWRRI
jgi:hypothetical protein